jgi:hypothetical protein
VLSKERPSSLACLLGWAQAKWAAHAARGSRDGLTRHLEAVSQPSGTLTVGATPRRAAAGRGRRKAACGILSVGLFLFLGEPAPLCPPLPGRSANASVAAPDKEGGAGADGAPRRERLSRSMTQGSGVDCGRTLSGGSGLSAFSGTSAAASRRGGGAALISAEEFDMTLEGLEMPGGCVAVGQGWKKLEARVERRRCPHC